MQFRQVEAWKAPTGPWPELVRSKDRRFEMSRSTRIANTIPLETPMPSRWRPEFEAMEAMFDDLWRPRFFDWDRLRTKALHSPALDVYQDGDDMVVEAEFPGTHKEDLDVQISNSVMTITGRKTRREETEDEKFYRSERTWGTFSRSVDLPRDVDTSRAKASFTDGVLVVRVPITEAARDKTLRIAIK